MGPCTRAAQQVPVPRGCCALAAGLGGRAQVLVSVAGLTNGFGGVRSEQELGSGPGRKATPRRRCASESSISSSSSPLCGARWAPGPRACGVGWGGVTWSPVLWNLTRNRKLLHENITFKCIICNFFFSQRLAFVEMVVSLKEVTLCLGPRTPQLGGHRLFRVGRGRTAALGLQTGLPSDAALLFVRQF